MTLFNEHFWEYYLLFSLAIVVAVWLLGRLILDWRSDQQHLKARLTHAEAMYCLKGYDAMPPRPNVRRA